VRNAKESDLSLGIRCLQSCSLQTFVGRLGQIDHLMALVPHLARSRLTVLLALVVWQMDCGFF
jgi:hypothetical protein